MILPYQFHTPVLLPQVIDSLQVTNGKKYIDATLGGGGYTDEILKLRGIVLGIDQDKEAIDFVRQKYQINKDLFLVHGNFKDLKEIAHSNKFDQVSGIIFDLGMSSFQLEKSGRGFSYVGDEVLDMRMDAGRNPTASEIINNYSKEKLYEIFTKYAEELHSRTISEAIVCARSLGKIEKTDKLVKLIEEVLDRIYAGEGRLKNQHKYQATKARIFQALRITVNNELENLEIGLKQAIGLLVKEGRIVVLSYHSLEDRMVKLTFRKYQNLGELKLITSTIGVADREERKNNPKAKSAKLRIAEKIN